MHTEDNYALSDASNAAREGSAYAQYVVPLLAIGLSCKSRHSTVTAHPSKIHASLGGCSPELAWSYQRVQDKWECLAK